MESQWEKLPPELLENIFDFLRLDDMKNASLVCKKWFDATLSAKVMRKAIVYLSNNYFHLRKMLTCKRKFSKLVFYHIKDEDIKEYDFGADRLLTYFGQTVKELQFISCKISEYKLYKILNLFTKLTSLKVDLRTNLNGNVILYSYIDKLKTLSLERLIPFDQEFLLSIENKVSTIENLSIKISRTHRNENMIPTIGVLNKLASNLKELSLFTFENYDIIFNKDFLDKIYLKSLRIDTDKSIFISLNFKTFTLKMISIVKLDISSEIENDDFIEICENMTNLQELIVRDCQKLTDDGIIEVTRLKNLEILKIDYCRKITNDGIMNGIASKLNEKIQHIILIGYYSDEILIKISHNLLKLKTLKIRTHLNLNANIIKTVFKHLKELTYLSLWSIRNAFDNEVEADLSNDEENFTIGECKYIQYLKLNGFCEVPGATLKDIAELVDLEYLSLDQYSKVSKEDIEYLVKKCPQLKALTLFDLPVCIESKLLLSSSLRKLKYLNYFSSLFK